jgi:hypothetical protein
MRTVTNSKETMTLYFRSVLITALLLGVLAMAACGSENSGSSGDDLLPKITPSDRVFTQEDFLATGLKLSKEYDVSELPGAVSAIYGFWKPDGAEPVDYELRFYPSHEAALQEGQRFADEVTGPDGAVSDNDVTWKEGTRDRRTSGFTVGGGGGSLAVKYADYIIHSNVIMLCQGRDSGQSIGRCWALINEIADVN